MLTPRTLIARSLFGFVLLSALVGRAQTFTTSNLTQPLVDPDFVRRTPDDGADYVISYGSAFVTGSDSSILNGISLALASGGSYGSGFTVTVHQLSGEMPGAVLETLSGSGSPTTGGTYDFTSAGLSLEANTTYAIVASVSAPSYGRFNIQRTVSNGETGSAGWSVADLGYQFYDDAWHTDPAKLVFSVSAGVSAVPEPSTWAALVGACALGATVLVRRQRRAA